MDDEARSLIADYLGLPPPAVEDSRDLADLGADPLDILALVARLEKAFGVRIADAQAQACRTVGDLLVALREAGPRQRRTAGLAAQRPTARV